LVLKNGILWHLECKTATAELHELDARLLNLQRAGSNLARLLVCAPILTRGTDQPWFGPLHKLRGKIEGLRHVSFLPFTLPDQPDRYTLSDGAGQMTEFPCPSFEEALGVQMRPLLPANTPADQPGPSSILQEG
jgi:hypothetical protein